MKGKQTMRNFLLLLSILLLFTSCEMKQDTLTQKKVEETILAREHKTLDRWAAGDPFGFSENSTEDVTWFDDVAAQTRIDGLEELRSYLKSFVGKIPPQTYEIVDPKVQVYGDIAVCTLHYNPIINGKPDSPWKATDVYRLTNGEWRLVHVNWSLVK